MSCICRCRTNICPLVSYKTLMGFSCDLAQIEVAVVSSSWLVWSLHLEFCRRSPVAERIWLSREFYYSNAKPSIVIVNCQPWWKLACQDSCCKSLVGLTADACRHCFNLNIVLNPDLRVGIVAGRHPMPKALRRGLAMRSWRATLANGVRLRRPLFLHYWCKHHRLLQIWLCWCCQGWASDFLRWMQRFNSIKGWHSSVSAWTCEGLLWHSYFSWSTGQVS